MQRLSAWARWIGAGVFTIFVIPIAVEFVKHMAENIGLYDRPREAAGTVLNFFLGLAELPWLHVTALVLGSFVAGVWLDWLLRKFDGSRAKARENLGYEMSNLAHDIDNALALVDRFGPQDFSPRLMSTFIKAKQKGLWTPDVRMPPNVVMPYLRHVGTLLSDGHFAEAKQAALECKEAFEKRAKQSG
jgi:amino acid transporter